ncbi:hypothetical protein ACU4GD_15160 [Cupriavidus basilensis]
MERAKAAGSDAELHFWRALPHVWQLYHPFLPEARRALPDAAAFCNAGDKRLNACLAWLSRYFP